MTAARVGLTAFLTPLVLTGALATQSPPKPAPRGPVQAAIEAGIVKALDAYASGDDQAAQLWLKTLKGREALSILPTIVARRGTWTRSDAAFLLEAALAGTFDNRTIQVLAAGRSMVMSRPSPVGWT